jgi:hypothetical protein
MALKKQSIRSNQKIFIEDNQTPSEKEEILLLSEDWNEMQEILFRKMLKQGGTFKVAGVKFKIILNERGDIDSKGNRPVTVPPLP